jgi:hypothetical protein
MLCCSVPMYVGISHNRMLSQVGPNDSHGSFKFLDTAKDLPTISKFRN